MASSECSTTLLLQRGETSWTLGEIRFPVSPWSALEKNTGNFLWCDEYKGMWGKQYSSLPCFFHPLLQITGIPTHMWDKIRYGDTTEKWHWVQTHILNLIGKPACGQFRGMLDTTHFDIPRVLCTNWTKDPSWPSTVSSPIQSSHVFYFCYRFQLKNFPPFVNV